MFLSSSADICVYGGAKGGGKTVGLLMEAARHIDNGDYGAVVFRRTYPQVTMEGGMWDESQKMYPAAAGKMKISSLSWHFPSGARISFRYMEHEKDKQRYQGAQIPLICFDQLEEFSESQFFFMLAQNRSTCGVRPYVRATCNPDPDSFLRHFLSWWIADDGYADLSKEGKTRWFIRFGERLVWADSKEELAAQYPMPEFMPKSVSFIPATVYDNVILLQADPSYLANLMALPPVDRERLLGHARRGGNWDVRPSAGKVFNRADFQIVDAVPAGGVEVRFWDLAATEKEISGPDPDFTASVRMRKVRGAYYVMDCTAEQMDPRKTDERIANLAAQDYAMTQESGTRYMVRWEREGGASGKRDSYRLTQMMAKYDCGGVAPRGEKMVRARPLASQATVGNVKLLRGRWNEDWLNHMHNQPETPKKDIMDASSGAYDTLVHLAGADSGQSMEQAEMPSRWMGGAGRWGEMR